MSEESLMKETDIGFDVCDRQDGTFYINVNPYHPSLPFLENAVVGFELRHKMSVKEVDAFAKLLRENIKAITYMQAKGAGVRPYHPPIVRNAKSGA